VRESFAQERWLWGGMALAVGLLTLYSMLKIGLEAFWKPHPAGHAIVPVAGLGPAYGAVILLTALILLMGLWPEPFIHYAEAAAASLGRGGGAP